jgi:lysophospholipase L1-like esterase
MLLKRLALVLMGLVLGVLVLEGGLQAAAFFVKRSTRSELPAAWVTGNLRVLCLGDSNTYGLRLPRNEAYPQQLEAIWNERVKTPKLEVLNLGFPGTNSSRLVRDMPRLLETFDPDIVIVMVGVNDFWTLPYAIDDGQGAPKAQPRKNFIQRHSLLYRLYYLVRRGQVANEVEIIMDPQGSLEKGAQHKARVGGLEFDMGFVKADEGLQGDAEGLKQNLVRLAGQARSAGTRFYLMTYPSRKDFYRPANDMIEAAARDGGIELIDLEAIFEPICPRVDCPETFFDDGHPKAPGYRRVAESVLERIGGHGPS